MNHFQEILFQDANIIRETTPVIMSSRIRLARNLSPIKFVNYASQSELHTSADLCTQALTSTFKDQTYTILDMKELKDYEKHSLVERHLCSKEFANEYNESRLFLTSDHTTSIMINEEDHLRIQVFSSTTNFHELFDKINTIDDELYNHLDIAFDERLGFLTSCPTNVGTGMRASVMLHLPALVTTKQMNHLVLAVQKLGFVVRGLFGEGSDAQGDFFQISNQQTLGLSEVDILSRLNQIIHSIIDYELSARELLKKDRMVWLFDRIGRSFGTLQSSYTMSSEEAINLISVMMLASEMGHLKEGLKDGLHQLMMQVQDAHLQVAQDQVLKPAACDLQRSHILREFFKSLSLHFPQPPSM